MITLTSHGHFLFATSRTHPLLSNAFSLTFILNTMCSSKPYNETMVVSLSTPHSVRSSPLTALTTASRALTPHHRPARANMFFTLQMTSSTLSSSKPTSPLHFGLKLCTRPHMYSSVALHVPLKITHRTTCFLAFTAPTILCEYLGVFVTPTSMPHIPVS